MSNISHGLGVPIFFMGKANFNHFATLSLSKRQPKGRFAVDYKGVNTPVVPGKCKGAEDAGVCDQSELAASAGSYQTPCQFRGPQAF